MQATEKLIYADLKREHRDLLRLEGGDSYWVARAAFKVNLQSFLRDDESMLKLPKVGCCM